MISFVYFDVGGVVIKDFSQTNNWSEMLLELGISKPDLPNMEELWSKLAARVNLDYDVDNLIPHMNQHFNLDIPHDYSLLDEFINRFYPNHTLWPIIDQLKSQVKVGLLTNMYPRMFAKIKAANLFPPIDWDAVIDSSSVGHQKPDPQIYHLAKKQAKVEPSQILFIDNRKDNLATARSLGWQTFWYDSSNYQKSSQQLADFFKGHV